MPPKSRKVAPAKTPAPAPAPAPDPFSTENVYAPYQAAYSQPAVEAPAPPPSPAPAPMVYLAEDPAIKENKISEQYVQPGEGKAEPSNLIQQNPEPAPADPNTSNAVSTPEENKCDKWCEVKAFVPYAIGGAIIIGGIYYATRKRKAS